MRTVNPEQHARRRAQILAAAAQEFAASGVDGTSTARICRRARIGSGTLFHYFPTKRKIFHAVFADELARNAEACREALAAADAEAGLDLVIRRLAGDLTDPLVPGLAAAALLQANRDPEFAAMLAADEAQTLITLTALLERMAARRRRSAFPPRRAARWIMTTIDAVFLAAVEDDFDSAAHTAELWQVVGWLAGRDGGVSVPAGRPAPPPGR
jgi:AcrR family transcriptional regulator